jgi:succinyl-diaminopimelate desuccinylase
MEALHQQGIHIDYCVVGEPSSRNSVGDEIKIGRRGSLSAAITLQGIQGHVAYPHLARNPIHEISPVLAALSQTQWDEGNAHFPPTSLQITHIQSGGEAGNIIPGSLFLRLNLRFSTEQTPEKLQAAVIDCFNHYQLTPEITWKLNGSPFLTATGQLLKQCVSVIENLCGNPPAQTTNGGTSDGRFIAPYGVEVIELGLSNATIHKVNECVKASDLIKLRDIYTQLCVALLHVSAHK